MSAAGRSGVAPTTLSSFFAQEEEDDVLARVEVGDTISCFDTEGSSIKLLVEGRDEAGALQIAAVPRGTQGVLRSGDDGNFKLVFKTRRGRDMPVIPIKTVETEREAVEKSLRETASVLRVDPAAASASLREDNEEIRRSLREFQTKQESQLTLAQEAIMGYLAMTAPRIRGFDYTKDAAKLEAFCKGAGATIIGAVTAKLPLDGSPLPAQEAYTFANRMLKAFFKKELHAELVPLPTKEDDLYLAELRPIEEE